MAELKEYHQLTSSTFQDFVVDLFNAKENTNTYAIWGRHGQKQNGIDVFSAEQGTIIQCKYKNDSSTKTKQQLKAEIEEEVKKAIGSGVKFNHFILTSTYPHDVELQHFAISLRDAKEYKFNISYVGWDELKKWTIQQPVLLNRYFGNILKPEMVELVSINIDTEACSWDPVDGFENVFYDKESETSPYPVFDFTFVNRFNKTIVLKSIRLFAKSHYSGLSGLPLPPSKVESIHTYQMKFQYGKENLLRANPPIQIGADQAFRFKLQLLKEYSEEIFQIEGRNVLYFSFDFNSDITVVAPKVYLNTKNDNAGIPIYVLS